MFLASLMGQTFFGWHAYDDERLQRAASPMSAPHSETGA
jgi:hypothetical protein